MELEGSLPCSQEPSTGPCSEPDESITTSYFLKASLNELHIQVFHMIECKALMAGYFVCSAAIQLCKFDDISLALRWLLRHIPLVSPFARDPDFRVLHPYAARNEATFLQWNIGKQRAAEVGSFGYVTSLHNMSKHSYMVSAFYNLFVCGRH
jgi:hypothetical protein